VERMVDIPVNEMVSCPYPCKTMLDFVAWKFVINPAQLEIKTIHPKVHTHEYVVVFEDNRGEK